MKNIAVCIKQVPDTTDIQWSKENNIVRDGMLSIVNPQDEYAIHIALKIKEELKEAKVSAFSMGPAQAKQALEFALAQGCDNAFLLNDSCFIGSDTLATGKTIAQALRRINDFDIIVCGQYALDGDTAQTGATIANFLEIEHISWVLDVSIKDDKLKITKEQEGGINVYEAGMPLLISVLNENFVSKMPKIEDYINAQNKKIIPMGCGQILIAPFDTGIKGSPTYVSKVFRKQIERKPDIIEKFDTNEFLNKFNEMKNDAR